MDLFTEKYKLKDIILEMEESEQKETKKECENLKALAKGIAKKYDIKEDEIEYIRKKNPLKAEDIKIEDGERAAIRYITTADVDRDNEIVLPDGLQVNDFKKSMTVLYAHDYRGLPIGRDLWIKLIKGKGWLAKTVYAAHQLASDVYNLVKEHFLNTSSIGFIPLESMTPDKKGWDKVKDKVMAEYGIKEKLIDNVKRIYTKVILLEHSDVPIPSNINALNIAVGKGFIKNEDLLKDIKEEIEIVEGEEKTGDELEGEAIELKDVEKPYPNEHSCRMRSPGDFQPDSFRRMTRSSDGKEYSVIMGRLKGETKLIEQAYRYGIKVWTVSEAKKHCKDHKGILFEPASGKEETESLDTDVPQSDNDEPEEEQNKSFSLDEIYEIVKENKELIIALEEVTAELKAGAVLNKKNKTDLTNAQKLIQNVLDSATSEEGSKTVYECECLKCGWKHTSEKHCDSYKCSQCGGDMRRTSRPGPGKELDEIELDFEPEKKDEGIELDANEIKDIIKDVIKENVKDFKEEITKGIDDNFKRATGKVL